MRPQNSTGLLNKITQLMGEIKRKREKKKERMVNVITNGIHHFDVKCYGISHDFNGLLFHL